MAPQDQNTEQQDVSKFNILFVERPGGPWTFQMKNLVPYLAGYMGRSVTVDFYGSTATAARAAHNKDYNLLILDAGTEGLDALTHTDREILERENLAEILDGKASDFTPDDLVLKLRHKYHVHFRVIGLCDNEHNLLSANRKLNDKSPLGELTQYITEWM